MGDAPYQQSYWSAPNRPSDYDAFVTNLPYDTTEDEIATLLGQVGVIDRVSILTDKHSGRSRGMGSVTYVAAESAILAAEAFNGVLVKGRPMRVNSSYALRLKKSMVDRAIDLAPKDEPTVLKMNAEWDPAGEDKPDPKDLARVTDVMPEDKAPTESDLVKERLIESVSSSNYLSTLKEVQSLTKEHPAIAAQIFKSSPAILFAVLHSLSIVDNSLVTKLLDDAEPRLLSEERMLQVKQVVSNYRDMCGEVQRKIEQTKPTQPHVAVILPRSVASTHCIDSDDSSSLEDFTPNR